MSEPRDIIVAAPATLDYARPTVLAPPRPGVALWVAAGIVWSACVLSAALLLLEAIYAASFEHLWLGGRVAWAGVLSLVALIEWAAVARRSALAARVVCVPAAMFAGVVMLGALDAGTAPAARPWRGLCEFAAIAAASHVVVAHSFWAARLREHARRGRPRSRQTAGGYRGTV